jgi:hypothetical protein
LYEKNLATLDEKRRKKKKTFSGFGKKTIKRETARKCNKWCLPTA